MRIKNLITRNFRSLRELDVELPQLCALVGPNNAGKSNILQAINRLTGRAWVRASDFSEDDVYGHDPDLDISIVLKLDPSLEYVPFKNAEPTKIASLGFEYTRYQIGPQKGERRLEQSLLDPKGKPSMTLAKAPKKGESHQYKPLTSIPTEAREQIPVIYIGSRRAVRDQLPSARGSLLKQLLEDIDEDFHDPEQVVTITDENGSHVRSLGRNSLGK